MFIDFAFLILCGDIQPYRPATQILERVLRFHLGDAQILILQHCADQELCTANVLKDCAHECIRSSETVEFGHSRGILFSYFPLDGMWVNVHPPGISVWQQGLFLQLLPDLLPSAL